MELQSVYETVRAYFTRPGAVLAKKRLKRANEYGDKSVCAYRDPKGNKCAFGCQLSDELYDTLLNNGFDLEGMGNIAGISESLRRMPASDNYQELRRLIGRPGTQLNEFQLSIQAAHDLFAADATEFVQLLDSAARQYGLKVAT